MKALLMHRDRELNLHQERPWNEQALVQDLELGTLIHAMARGDEFLSTVARASLLSGFDIDLVTILYRQQVLKDCLKNSGVVRKLYDLTVEATVGAKRQWWGLSSDYPSSMLYSSVDLLEFLLGMLRKLMNMAGGAAVQFDSVAFTALFATLQKELGNEYLASIEKHLKELKFRKGVLVNAQLGEGNEGIHYVLSQSHGKDPNWLERILGNRPQEHTFYLAERDEAGARILSNMRDQAISRVAPALAQSSDHVLSFFTMLRTELAFYVGCLNLHDLLADKEEPVCFPVPAPSGVHAVRFRGLYDVSLSLRLERRVVGNTVDVGGKRLTIVTGANQGGKSSFLRSVGLAQVMMQCGMFVAAEAFESGLCPSLFTHYKREEDATMIRGKLDEELSRMSGIIDHLASNSILLFNESFAATNEREGSEIAKQVVCALLEKRIRIFYVTHLYEFARGFFDQKRSDTLFLRAERNSDGTRPFRLVEGEPLQTAYGEDLFHQIFEPHK